MNMIDTEKISAFFAHSPPKFIFWLGRLICSASINSHILIIYEREEIVFLNKGPSWSWSYCRWIYDYLCHQCLSPLTLWARIPFMAKCTRYNIMWSSLPVTCDRSVVLSTNKTDRHDIAEILLIKMASSTVTLIFSFETILSARTKLRNN